MPGETQGEEGAVADEEAGTRGWEGITGSLIFTEVYDFSSEAAAQVSALPLQALGVDVEEVPHGTHVALPDGLMDVLASGHEPNPLGTAGRGSAP